VLSGQVSRRAYAFVNFQQPECVFEFKHAFASRVWLDELNREQPWIIDYAPNQKLPQHHYHGDDDNPIEQGEQVCSSFP
jgi:Smg-4/UPF3 family